VQPLKSHGRYAYSAITRRADYSWPGRKRLAVYLGFNLEHFEFGSGLGAALGPKSPEPDVLNYAWRDYGNRVGAWRCLELFDSLKLPAGVILNTALYHYCPELVEACVKRGDELIGHGHTNSERQGELSAEKEKKLLEDCRDLILK
jgi:allantoinase